MGAIRDKFDKIFSQVSMMEPDVIKADQGNKAAGTRVRKRAQDIKNLCQEIRKTVTEERNG